MMQAGLRRAPYGSIIRSQHVRNSSWLPSSRIPESAPSNRGRRGIPFHFGLVIVAQQSQFIVERFGRFHRLLDPGLHVLIPVVDQISYVHSLKEEAVNVPNQVAITKDNVTINIDAVLYMRVENAYDASYGVEDPHRAVSLLAQTTMRSELGKLTLDKTFKEREALNALIVVRINEAAQPWGIKCLRYEIRDIHPPENVRKAMELQAEAERRKRAQILESEAEMQSEINIAEGQKKSLILSSEAEQIEKVNEGQGEANAILARARAVSEGFDVISSAIRDNERGSEAVRLRVIELYNTAFHQIMKKSNSVVVPGSGAGGDMSSLIAQAITLANSLSRERDTRQDGETGRESEGEGGRQTD